MNGQRYEYSIEVQYSTPISKGMTEFQRRVEGVGTAEEIADQLHALSVETRRKAERATTGEKMPPTSAELLSIVQAAPPNLSNAAIRHRQDVAARTRSEQFPFGEMG